MKLGFIGLGIMGKPMAKNLLKDGCNLLVYDINKSAVDELISCGAKYASVLEMGQECDIVFTILPNGTIVQDILFGMDGLAKTLKEGSIVVDMSSVTPTESILCANKLKDMYLREEKSFLDVSQATVLSTRERLPLQLRELDTSLLCLIQWNKPLFYKDFANEIP